MCLEVDCQDEVWRNLGSERGGGVATVKGEFGCVRGNRKNTEFL